ncbi:MAG: hypothetical protein AAB373_05550 [Patescibacteria group bacterium]
MYNAAYLTQLEQKINGLIFSKKYQEAYSLCKDIISKFPEATNIYSLKKKIEQEVAAENKRVVEQKIDSTQTFFDQKKYADAIKTLREALTLIPDYPKAKKLYAKAQELYQKQVEEIEKSFIEKQSKRLNEILLTLPNQLMDELLELETENAGNKLIMDLTSTFKDKLIEQKIKDKKELINSNKYQDLGNFIEQLKKIDPKNPRITDLQKSIHLNQHESQLSKKDEYVYDGLKYLDTLLKLKKYDKGVQLINELIKVDPQNKKLQNLLTSTESKYFGQLKNSTTESIISHLPSLKAEYESDKNKFVRI